MHTTFNVHLRDTNDPKVEPICVIGNNDSNSFGFIKICQGETDVNVFCSRPDHLRKIGAAFLEEATRLERAQKTPPAEADCGKSIGVQCCDLAFETAAEADAHEQQCSEYDRLFARGQDTGRD